MAELAYHELVAGIQYTFVQVRNAVFEELKTIGGVAKGVFSDVRAGDSPLFDDPTDTYTLTLSKVRFYDYPGGTVEVQPDSLVAKTRYMVKSRPLTGTYTSMKRGHAKFTSVRDENGNPVPDYSVPVLDDFFSTQSSPAAGGRRRTRRTRKTRGRR
jgi:hypothetical protein